MKGTRGRLKYIFEMYLLGYDLARGHRCDQVKRDGVRRRPLRHWLDAEILGTEQKVGQGVTVKRPREGGERLLQHAA